MDDHLETALRSALSRGLTFRMRIDEDGAAGPALYLRLIDRGTETTWSAALPPDGDLQTALVGLVGACARRILETGAAEGATTAAGRPLPRGAGLADAP